MTGWVILVIVSGQLFMSVKEYPTYEECVAARPIGVVSSCAGPSPFDKDKK